MEYTVLGSRPVAPASVPRGGLIRPGLLFAVLAGLAPVTAGEPAPKPDDAVSFSGRVIELGGGQPVAGATVVVSRALAWRVNDDLPPWAGETTLQTDANGRFTVRFSAEQVAEPGLLVALARVSHPEFVTRKGSTVPLRSMLQGRKFGDKPFFDTVTLERGIEYSGRVVTPEGRPAADVAYAFGNWAWSNRADDFSDDTEGRTDRDGRFRLRMPKTHALTLTLTPESLAPFQKFWGTDQASKNPDVWAPSELGRIVLERGAILSGRLRDLQGRPIAGQRIVAHGRQTRIQRTATTQADGAFTFAPLKAGNYEIFAEHQQHSTLAAPTAEALPMTGPVVRPAVVFWKPGDTPPPVELRELPTVTVEIRFVDAQGRPARGNFIRLGGGIPFDNPKDALGPDSPNMIPASAVNQPEMEDMNKRLGWNCRLAPDAKGRVVFRAPKGLVDASFDTFPPDETIAFKTRLVDRGPLKFWGGGRLGTLDTDRRGVHVFVYQSPTVVASLKTEEGEPVPAEATVEPGFDVKGFAFGGNVIRQADGRFRSQSLMPDHEYEFDAWAWAKRYVPKRVQRVNLPEGGEAELTLVLRKKPALPAVGNPAPPFSVATLDGQRLNLEDYRGKFVLLHFWGPFHKDDRDLPRLQAIHDRFGVDTQLAMLGLGLSNDLEAASKALKDHRLTWPQALMPDRSLDPIAMDYLCNQTRIPTTFLIDPDGVILATGLSVADAEKWLTMILGPR